MASSSLSYLLYHIIFSVKQRQWVIADSLQPRVHSYIAGIIKNIGGTPIIVGGQRDHIHILCLLPKHISISETMKLIKGRSSYWYNHEVHDQKTMLKWQDGYDVLTVSPDNLEKVKNYILHQEEHHRTQSFAEERAVIEDKLSEWIGMGAGAEDSLSEEGSG